ncbi:hypothetical protein DFR24_2112 [Panacagrimonas perspica]|uniref:Uncharacterized protein n=1 Tax=Panacagrimonas perspica TaxID=381431 RepID=A0A4S3KB45_9GAMM|nr:hypothetical protein [Panacagrimonas perspica]TDU32712.1 hypothetical protein DFR24_2112 [Panacagrimonas perspica]THD05592.1 hypothetical protein B1810_02430 [Panacagrimonas perspica]
MVLSDPDKFFKYYPLQMVGAAGPWTQNGISTKTFYVGKRNAGTIGTVGGKEGHYGATRPGFMHKKNISSLKMSVGVVPGRSGALTTHGIPMVNYNSNKYGGIDLHGNIAAKPHFVPSPAAN